MSRLRGYLAVLRTISVGHGACAWGCLPRASRRSALLHWHQLRAGGVRPAVYISGRRICLVLVAAHTCARVSETVLVPQVSCMGCDCCSLYLE